MPDEIAPRDDQVGSDISEEVSADTGKEEEVPVGIPLAVAAEIAEEEARRQKEIDDLIAAHWKGERRRDVPVLRVGGIGGVGGVVVTKGKVSWRTLAIVAVALVLVFSVPLFFLPNILSGSKTANANPSYDLAQFSRSHRNESSDAAAVARVVKNAKQTEVADGGVVWAEWSGSTCLGVEVSSAVVSDVSVQPNTMCK